MCDELIALDIEIGQILVGLSAADKADKEYVQATTYFKGIALARAKELKQGDFDRWAEANQLEYTRQHRGNLIRFAKFINRILLDAGRVIPNRDALLASQYPVRDTRNALQSYKVQLPESIRHVLAIAAKVDESHWAKPWREMTKDRDSLKHLSATAIEQKLLGDEDSHAVARNPNGEANGLQILPAGGPQPTFANPEARSEPKKEKALPAKLKPDPVVFDVPPPMAPRSLPSPETAKSTQTGNAELERALKRIAELEAEVASLREENGKLREENGKPAEELHLANGEDIEARAKQWVAVYDSCDAKTKTKLFRAIREKRLKSDAGELDADFEAFWQAYPASGRANRRKTYQEWEEAMVRLRKTSKEEPEGGWVAFIIGRAAFMASSPIAKRDNGKYVKNAENWLKADGWWDDDAKYNREEYNKMTVGMFRPEDVGKGGVL